MSCQILEKLLGINTAGQEIPLPATHVWLVFQKGGFKRFRFNVLMSQQIAVPYSNRSLKLINSEDALKGVLLYKKKRKGDFTHLLFA